MKRQRAQQWLDKNYPREKRVNFKNLDISGRNLEGSLKLEGFSNLEKLDCSNNLITELSLDPSSEEKITKLNLRDNNFDEQDLTCFSRFVNLKKLYLGTTKERIQQGCYNRFSGSLEPLKDLSELEELSISNTGIDSGLEHLPERLEKIYCVNDLGISGGCEKVRKELKNYSSKTPFWSKQYHEYYDLRKWKREQRIVKEAKNNNEMSLIVPSSPSSIATAVYNYNLSVNRQKTQQIQKWLDENYPKEKRSGRIKLDISFSKIGEVLEGPLDLRDFKDLRFLDCSGHKITELKLGSHPQLGSLYCNNNQLTRLYIGNLPELTNVDCSDNQLNSLVISICPKLTELYCSNNHLTSFDFSKLDEENLTHINLNDNDFSRCDLSVLAPFVNLKSIGIGSRNGNQEKIDEGIYNCFCGSLKHLRNMDKLEILNINATDVNEGLEYLPRNLKEFYCTSYGTVTKVEEIEEVLKNHPDIPQDQQSPASQPQNPFKDVVLLGVGKKEGDLSGLFSSLGPNYINNLQKWRKVRMFSSEISEDDVSVYEEFRNQLEEQVEERNFNQGQVEIPPKNK